MEHLELLLICLTNEEIENLFFKLESISKNLYIHEDGPVEKLLFRLSEEIDKRKNNIKGNSRGEIKLLDDDLIYKILSDEEIEKLQLRLESLSETKTILEEKNIKKLLNELSEEKKERAQILENSEELLNKIGHIV